jgi:hypothetical protein
MIMWTSGPLIGADIENLNKAVALFTPEKTKRETHPVSFAQRETPVLEVCL